MNKNLLILGVIVVIVLLGVGGFLVMNKKKVDVVAPQTSESQTAADVIASIKDAFTNGTSFECTYTDEGRTTKTYVKNGMVRAEITSSKPEQAGNTIIKDKKMYFWNSMSAFMMTIPDVTTTPGPSGTVNTDDLIENMEKYKDSCKMASVSDDLFTPPSDVKFQDMSSMMKAAPSGAGTADQKQIEEMMKKYLTPTATQ